MLGLLKPVQYTIPSYRPAAKMRFRAWLAGFHTLRIMNYRQQFLSTHTYFDPRKAAIKSSSILLLISLFGFAAARPLFADSLTAVPATAYYPTAPQKHLLPASSLDQQQLLSINFALKGDDDGLNEFTREQYDPASPNYQKWITPEEFGDRFGASAEEIALVERWANANGLKITYIAKGRRLITAVATMAVVQKALSTTLGAYERTGAEQDASGAVSAEDVLFAPKTSPLLPSAVAEVVSSIGGLTNASFMKPMLRRLAPETTTPKSVGPHITPSALTPIELASVYDLAPLQSSSNSGSGMKIGIYEPALYSASDIAKFKSQYGVTAATPLVEYPSSIGRTTDSKATDTAEADLDIEIINGLAPNAQIVLYEAPLTEAGAEAQYAQMADDALPVISNSWGGPEDTSSEDSYYFKQLNSSLQQMATEGTSFFSSSGDTGAFDNPSTPRTPSVDFPASSPYGTACGGTALPSVNSDYSWNQEIAWDDSGGATGGGISLLFTRPSWQNNTVAGVVNQYSTTYRQVPDVSSVAGEPGVSIYAGGAFNAYGGTSAASPVWSAASLMIGKLTGGNLGLFAQTLYGLAANSNTYNSAFHDIVSGTNNLYSCTSGWDYPTGLGTADYTKLYQALTSQNSSGSASYTFAGGLQMISSPYNYGSATLSELFSPLPKLAFWNPSAGRYAISPTAPANTLQQGYGYWADFNGSTVLQADSSATTGNAVSIPLYAGWNMIGLASTSTTSVSSLSVQTSSGSTLPFANAVSGGYVSSQLYTYGAGATAYTLVTTSGTLTPYAGYWLYAAQNCTLVIP